MKTYHYEVEGKTKVGVIFDGTMEASSAEDVARELEHGFVYYWGRVEDIVIYAGVKHLYMIKEI